MKKIIRKFMDSQIALSVIADTRGQAWLELLAVGAVPNECGGAVYYGKNVICVKGIINPASLIDIEKLERDGWEW